MKSDLYNLKWNKFLKRVKPFEYVPFTDFVLVAGSLATGKVHEKSDFDVIVGVREGRIFTNRFFAHLVFALFGYRRRGDDHKDNASDKICLSHFVTPPSYRLGGPKNSYWQELYHSLVPIMGNEDTLRKFFSENDWLDPKRIYTRDKRYMGVNRGGGLSKLMERCLSGGFGNWLEKKLGAWQIKRIEAGLSHSLGYQPRLVYSYEELRFHMDTKRIERMLGETSS